MALEHRFTTASPPLSAVRSMLKYQLWLEAFCGVDESFPPYLAPQRSDLRLVQLREQHYPSLPEVLP